MFGRVNLLPLGFPEEKPLYTKEPLYQLQHINSTALNVYLKQLSTKSPQDPFIEFFIKNTNLRSEAPYFYSLEYAKAANVRFETISSCYPLFRNECLPRSLAGLLSTAVCPVLDVGYSASCLPLQEACFTLRSYKAVIFLSPTNLNSTCPILYHTWLDQFADRYSLNYYVDEPIFDIIRSRARTIVLCVDPDLDSNCEKLYKFHTRNALTTGKLPSLPIITEE